MTQFGYYSHTHREFLTKDGAVVVVDQEQRSRGIGLVGEDLEPREVPDSVRTINLDDVPSKPCERPDVSRMSPEGRLLTAFFEPDAPDVKRYVESLDLDDED
ncbi:hypothetical protein ACPYPG_21170 [Streptomyces sp. FR-108]|uniref:hypothetical protein n=1 Tax=Streptomyces sp. FR-108 TaxID=3416665 RepID=UPI003CF9EC63